MRTPRAAFLAAILAMVFAAVPTTAGAMSPSDVRTKIAALRARLKTNTARLEAAELRLNAAETAIERHERSLRTAGARLDELQEGFRTQAAELYMSGGMEGLELLDGSTDIATFVDRMSYLEQVRTEERAIAEEIRALRSRADIEGRELVVARTSAASNRKETITRQQELSADLHELLKLQQYLVAERRILRGGRSSSRGLVCPVAGPRYVANNFGDPRPGGPHTGNDIRADAGQPVVAVLPGRIVDAPNGGWIGIGIVLRDPTGTEWLYAHLGGRSVQIGEKVMSGEVIGRVGCTGTCYGPHLHFEWHPDGGGPRDPYGLLSRAC